MKIHPIYTEDNNCQDCYKCVRECPVKAIKIENSKASIINERCIYCGHCTTICPSEAKRVREDVKTVNYFIEHNQTVIASLAPSYKTEFPEWNDAQLIKALHQLGFKHVSETALGAEMVSVAVNEWLETKEDGIYLSSCCPTVVDLIHNYYPEIIPNITPIYSPMLAHGKYLKEKFGSEVKVVFIGPCIAKKKEAEKNPGYIDAVLTFKKLREWFNKKGIAQGIGETTNEEFYPQKSNLGAIYPIDGGMLTSLNNSTGITSKDFMCFSGLDNIIDLLKNRKNFESVSRVFLELMACSGGCVNGPVTTNTKNTALKRTNIISEYHLKDHANYSPVTFKGSELFSDCEILRHKPEKQFTDEEISEALKTVGKYSEKDEVNCSGCGYESCHDFAKAMLQDIAEPTMCVSHMRHTAQRQASLLMHKMPYAVVLVDENLKIIESNLSFSELLGESFELAYERNPGLGGLDLRKILPFYKHFESLLNSGAELLEKDFKLNGKTIQLSLFTIQKNKIVCGILHGFNTPEIIKSEIAKRAKQVIKQNLRTVQNIALLLGENASETEALLNSLVHIDDNDE